MSKATILLIASMSLVAVGGHARSEQSDRSIRTYIIQTGKDDKVLAEFDLRVGGNEESSFSRSWPVEGITQCVPQNGVKRYAGLTNGLSIRIKPLPVNKNAKNAFRSMQVFGEWKEYWGMPSGVDTGDCDSFPSNFFASQVIRTIPMEFSNSITLNGDNGLFVRISKK